MKICASCSFENEEQARHCVECGQPLTASPDKTAPGEPLAEALALSAKPDAPPAGAEKPGKPRPMTKADPGTVIDGKYAIVRVLGEGGMGVVYLARDVHTGIEVVLKAVRPELAHRQDIRMRTLAEGRALAKIDHPNVVHLNAVVVQGAELWLVMQYIDGESLDKRIRRHRKSNSPMPLADALAIFEQIVSGVGAAHREGVIHRDLKPANVLVRSKDQVAKVTDFGIAKPEEQARQGKGNTKGVIGSLWYMSPEQVKGQRDLDKRVDIYALGILFFEMLVGHVPFDAKSSYDLMKMHVDEPLPRVREHRPDLPAAIEGLLDRACAKDRDHRFASCEELLSALRGLQTKVDTTAADGLDPLPADDAGDKTDAAETRAPSRAASVHSGDTAPASSITNAGEPEAASSSSWIVPAAALAGLVVVGIGAAYGTGMFGSEKKPTTGATTGQPADLSSAEPVPGVSSGKEPMAGPSATPATSPTEALAGKWRSGGGNDFEAVLVGNVLEFRVVDAEQLTPQNYVDGEARFTLTPQPGQADVYAVEDMIRPFPPERSTYAPESRNTCQEVWTEAGGKPLLARFDGARLTVDFAKIEPDLDNFTLRGAEVIGCVGLRSLDAQRLKVILTRPED